MPRVVRYPAHELVQHTMHARIITVRLYLGRGSWECGPEIELWAALKVTLIDPELYLALFPFTHWRTERGMGHYIVPSRSCLRVQSVKNTDLWAGLSLEGRQQGRTHFHAAESRAPSDYRFKILSVLVSNQRCSCSRTLRRLCCEFHALKRQRL